MRFSTENNPTAFPTADCSAADESAALMTAGRYMEAFLRLKPYAESAHPSVMFNLALCYCQADDYPAAAMLLEKALRNLKTLPMRAATIAAEPELTLRRRDIDGGCWLVPMNAAYPPAFCVEARQNILMVAVHVALLCGQRDKAVSLSAGLVGTQFEEFKAELLQEGRSE